MPKVTLTEAGVALILLEQELRNNYAEFLRWERRTKEVKRERQLAWVRMKATERKIEAIKESLK